MIKAPKFTAEQLESLDKVSLMLLILGQSQQMTQMADPSVRRSTSEK